MSGSDSILFTRFQFGLFLLQISSFLERWEVSYSTKTCVLLATNFLFLEFIWQHFQFLFTLSTYFFLLDDFIMDITSQSIFPDKVTFSVMFSQFSSSMSSFNLKVSVAYNISFCSFSANFSFFLFPPFPCS